MGDELESVPTLTGPREGKALLDRPVNDDFNRYQIQQNMMGLPVAIPNEPPFIEDVVGANPLGNLPGHDHRKIIIVSEERHVKHYSKDDLKKLYEKSMTNEGQMAEFKDPDPNAMSWEM